jgi:hypothetical protein
LLTPQDVTLVEYAAAKEPEPMNVTAIREAKNAIPFKPFTLALVDGRRMEVKHQDFISFSQSGRSVFVHHANESYSVLEPMVILSLEFAAPASTNGPAAPPA